MGADMCYENHSNVQEHYGGGAASATEVWEGLFEKLKRNQNRKDGEGVAMQSLGKNARSRRNNSGICLGQAKAPWVWRRKRRLVRLAQSCIHSRRKYILSFRYVSGTVLGSGEFSSEQNR